MSKDVALERLTRLREQLEAGSASGKASATDYDQLCFEWQTVATAVVAQDHPLHAALARSTRTFLGLSGDVEGSKSRAGVLKNQAALVARFIEQVQRGDVVPVATVAARPAALERVLQILEGFHRAVLQLRKRHDERDTLDVEDEYDVQDLLHAFLKVDFPGVREEEYTPSLAGSSNRMDFLLKAEQLVIETKMTNKSLGAKQVGNQLLIDIGRYAEHPHCKTLVCFVYDPDGHIDNPASLEHDLSRQHGKLDVRVLISPKP